MRRGLMRAAQANSLIRAVALALILMGCLALLVAVWIAPTPLWLRLTDLAIGILAVGSGWIIPRRYVLAEVEPAAINAADARASQIPPSSNEQRRGMRSLVIATTTIVAAAVVGTLVVGTRAHGWQFLFWLLAVPPLYFLQHKSLAKAAQAMRDAGLSFEIVELRAAWMRAIFACCLWGALTAVLWTGATTADLNEPQIVLPTFGIAFAVVVVVMVIVIIIGAAIQRPPPTPAD